MKVINRCCKIATVLAALLVFCKMAHSESNIQTEPVPKVDQVCLAEAISTSYKVPVGTALKIVKATENHSQETFPKQVDLLAIIAVESRFAPSAKSKGNYGLMQVNQTSHLQYSKTTLLDIDRGILAGSAILESMYKSTRQIRSAVLSYNVGIFGYKKGMYNPKYYALFQRNRSIIQERISTCST